MKTPKLEISRCVKLSATIPCCAAALLALASPGHAAVGAKPNVVLIVSDDQGWADVGWHGSEIKTPHLDRLAAAGARLEQFYAQPVCTPTRAALMTGRYPMRHGLQTGVIYPFSHYGLPLEERTLPEALRAGGYTTAICGKWHLGHSEAAYLPTRRGFDHQYGHYLGTTDYFEHTRMGGFDWHRDDRVCRDEGYSTFLVAKEAVRLIREQPEGKPLFLYVPFNAPHGPMQVPDEYKKPYANLPEPRRTYAGMVAAMDQAIGEIVAAVEAKGQRGNTLFIFSSDNGGPDPGKMTSNGPLRAGKGALYEGGVRVCALAAWDGRIKPGSVVNEPLHMVDLYPTLLKLAGVPVDQKLPLDGRDAWPTIAKGERSPHEAILINAAPTKGALRAGDWKLVLSGSEIDSDEPDRNEKAGKTAKTRRVRGKATVELFNLARDPYEKANLAESNPEKVRELRALYDAFARQAIPPQAKPREDGFKAPKVWGEPN